MSTALLDTWSIETRDLTKKFGDFTAVDRISFKVGKGEIFGFLGANGAGKTTAMRMLTGLLNPTSGSAFVAGYNIATDPESVKRNIGYMSQKFSLYQDLRVWENIEYYGGLYGMSLKEIREATGRMMEDLGMNAEKNVLVSELPLGWKQKLAFSIAIMHHPGIVFLDEPTGGVDPITRRQFWNMIYQTAREGITIFVTTHYMDEAEYCERVAIMVDGKIEAIGRTSELKSAYHAGSMDEVFYLLARGATRSE
jgi:ABC-2 type transport system ATP-binding protein